MPDHNAAAVRTPLTDAVGTTSRACAVAAWIDDSAASWMAMSVFNIR